MIDADILRPLRWMMTCALTIYGSAIVVGTIVLPQHWDAVLDLEMHRTLPAVALLAVAFWVIFALVTVVWSVSIIASEVSRSSIALFRKLYIWHLTRWRNVLVIEGAAYQTRSVWVCTKHVAHDGSFAETTRNFGP